MIAAQREVAPTPVAREPGPLDFLAAPSCPADLTGCWTLSDDERLLADAVRDFMDREVLPRTPALEAGDLDVLKELFALSAELGLTGLGVPEAAGGLGATVAVHGLREGRRHAADGLPRAR